MPRGTKKPSPETELPPDEYLTASELMARWKVSRQTLIRRVQAGELAALDVGEGSKHAWRFRRTDVDRYERRNRF